MSDVNIIQLVDANTICLVDANTLAIGTAVSGGAGLPLERKKKSRKEKKREKKQELERFHLARELIRQAEEKRQEQERKRKKPQKITAIKISEPVWEVEGVKEAEPLFQWRLSDSLFNTGEASGFILDAIRKGQAQREADAYYHEILEDDQEIIELYMQYRQSEREKISDYLSERMATI